MGWSVADRLGICLACDRTQSAPDANFFSNLKVDACTACSYSTQNGYFVLGSNNCFAPGSTQWLAYPFTSQATGAVARVKLAITDSGLCVATSNKFTVAIYSDACTNTPGTQIGSAVVAGAPAAPCALANANFAGAGVALTAGTKYWVVVTTTAANAQKGTTAVWGMANSGYAPYNLNDGGGWINFPDGAPGGFQVQ